jgi:hypothetical protein
LRGTERSLRSREPMSRRAHGQPPRRA